MRTALFNWLAARSSGGEFVLRIEDTDQQRHISGSEAQILESLRWLGLGWDEGPEVGGPHSPYIQSLRSDLYRAAAERLAGSGAAYWCDCSPERLEAMRAAQRRERQPTRYDRRCLARQEEVERARGAGARAVLRQRMPDGRTEWDDLIRGPIGFDNADIDDSVLLKADGLPTYHLANVVDDHAMGIDHVIRAEEWIPSTPKHLALYAAFGDKPPRFAHVPVVLGEDRQKLSKRRGAPDILEYRARGYLPQAVVNAMALLGWSSGDEQEVFSLEELRSRFSLDRVQAAPAVFDLRRLDDLNGIHIRRLELDGLVDALVPLLPGLDRETIRRLAPPLRERIKRLDEAAALVAPLVGALPDPPPPVPKGVDTETAALVLEATVAALEEDGVDGTSRLQDAVGTILDRRGVKRRDGFRVLYLALLGAPAGYPAFDAVRFLGAEESLRRLRLARGRVGAS